MKINISSLPCPGTIEIKPDDPSQTGIFIVKHEQGVSAFVNSCPHTGAPLNWQPDEFLDVEHNFIQCSLHGALFQLNDGLCIAGPCLNQSLTAVTIRIDADLIEIPASIAAK